MIIMATASMPASTFLEIWNSNESSFEHLLTYLGLLINGLLEMWVGLLTFYFRSLKVSQKIFFGSSLEMQLKYIRCKAHVV